MPQKRVMHAAPEALLELHDSEAAIGALIGERDEAASLSWFNCHPRDDGNAGACGNHRQDGGELTALKDDIRLQAGAPAHRERVGTKAMAILEQEKRIVLDLLH